MKASILYSFVVYIQLPCSKDQINYNVYRFSVVLSYITDVSGRKYSLKYSFIPLQ